MIARPFSQVVVWEGIVIGDLVEQFVEFCATEFNGARVKYIREIETNPDVNEFGAPMKGTGGRNDVLFAIHEDDVPKFAVKRIGWGMRWLDDVYGNGNGYLYPADVRELLSWNEPTVEPVGIDELLNSYREDGSETGCVGE
jgi:hypothetical protein